MVARAFVAQASNLTKIFGSDKHAREVIGEAGDVDGDSQISFEEFKAMMMRHEAGGKQLHHSHRDPAAASKAAAASPKK